MIVVAEYFRVSKKDEERGISIEVQQEAVRRWVQHNVPDAVLLPPYVDDGRSAYAENIANRPRFQQLIADARAKQFTHIVAYKYDRIARKNSVFFPFLAEMERLNITVVSATESNDWMMSSISGIFAEHFSRMLSARMTDVKRFDAQRGRWVGAVPFGYDRVDGKLIPNGDAWIVQLIFELYTSNGYAIMDIVDDLKARGLERRSACHNDGEPYPIGSQSVRQILMNAVYIGQVRCGDITVEGAHAAVVDRAIWEAAQEIRSRRNQHGGRLTIQSPDCGILTGIARCAVCGSAMWHMRSGKNRQQTYVCKGLLRLHACDNGRAHVPDVDRYALHVLSRIELPADWQQQALALIHTDRRPAQSDVAQLERERRKLREQFVSGLITLDQFQRQEAALNAQAIEHPPPAVLDLERAAARLTDFAALLEHATTDEQRAIMSTLFSEVWLRSSVIEAWAPREVYRPLFAVLYDEKRRGGRRSPTAFSPYPVLWASLNQPLVFGGAA